MKLRDIISVILILIGVFVIGFWLGKKQMPVTSTQVSYDSLPAIVISKDSSELAPASETKPDSIVYLVRYKDRPVADSSAIEQLTLEIDSLRSYLATIEDWNIKREYGDVLFDSDTLGRAEYTATVQYNKLVQFDYNYNPLQMIVTNTIAIPKNPRWGLGIQIGYGIGKEPSPYIGLGIQYNLFTF